MVDTSLIVSKAKSRAIAKICLFINLFYANLFLKFQQILFAASSKIYSRNSFWSILCNIFIISSTNPLHSHIFSQT